MTTTLKNPANVAALGDWESIEDFQPAGVLDSSGGALFNILHWCDDEDGLPGMSTACVLYGPDHILGSWSEELPF